MLLYTKNAINVFNVALIAPTGCADMDAWKFGGNPLSFEG
jgi:hypothetical protein